MCWLRYATFDGLNGYGCTAFYKIRLCTPTESCPAKIPCTDNDGKLRGLLRLYLDEDKRILGCCPEYRGMTPSSSWDSAFGK